MNACAPVRACVQTDVGGRGGKTLRAEGDYSCDRYSNYTSKPQYLRKEGEKTECTSSITRKDKEGIHL